jgi:hypothetical protein
VKPVVDHAAEAFARRSKVALVATMSPKARPFMTPLWFVVDAGVLYITTGTNTWAGRNVGRHPEVALLFGGERGMAPDRYLRMRGTATCHSGLPPLRVALRILAKYYVAPAALRIELRHISQWALRMRYYGGVPGGAGYIRVVPTATEFRELPRP